MIPVKEIEAEWIRIFELVRGKKPTVRLTDLVKSKWPKLYSKLCNSWGFAWQAIVTGLLDQSGVKVIDAETVCGCIECTGFKDTNDRPHDVDALVKLRGYEVPIQIGMFDGAFRHDADLICGNDGKPAQRKPIGGASYLSGSLDRHSMNERDTKRIWHKIRETPPGGITLLGTRPSVIEPGDDWWYCGVDEKCVVLWGVESYSIYYGDKGRLDAAKELCRVLGRKPTYVKSVKSRRSQNPKHAHTPFSGTSDELREAVQNNAEKWTADPDHIIGVLYYPAYASAYFRGLCNANGAKTDSLVPIIIHVAKQYVASHTERADDESGWRGVVSDMMCMLENLLRDKRVEFGAVVLKDTGCILQAIMLGRYEDYECSTLNVDEIYSRLHLRAFFCLIWVVARLRDGTPPEVLETLTAAARLSGQEGREHRIVLGCALGVLRWALPDWYEENESTLFGDDAPDGMNVVLMRVCSLSNFLDRPTMEKYHALALEALDEEMRAMRKFEPETGSREDVSYLMRYFIVHILHDSRGYEIDSSVKALISMGPDAVSAAGHECGWLIMKDDMKEFVKRAVQFWEAVLDSNPEPVALYGFGAWAYTKSVDQDIWERLTLRTCKITGGLTENLQSAAAVIERASSGYNPTKSGIRIMELVMRANKQLLGDLAVRDTIHTMRMNGVSLNLG